MAPYFLLHEGAAREVLIPVIGILYGHPSVQYEHAVDFLNFDKLYYWFSDWQF